MATYLMMIYVSLEQELAVKDLFTNKGWGFKKPGKAYFSVVALICKLLYALFTVFTLIIQTGR